MTFSSAYTWLLVAWLLIGCSPKDTFLPVPQATHGVLDLSNWDFSSQTPVALNGEWIFYWQQLCLPADSACITSSSAAYRAVPASWNNYTPLPEKITGQGYATYRLRIVLPASSRQALALRLPVIHTAAQVWVNGQQVYASGVVGKSSLTSQPAYSLQVVDLAPDAQQLDLLVQVSNFHYSNGGIRRPILLGTKDSLTNGRLRAVATEFWLEGSILIMALYHLGLFVIRRKDSAPLYFGVFCCLIALRIFITGEYTVHLFFEPDWWALIRLEYLTFTLGTAAFTRFVYSVFQVLLPRIALWTVLAVVALFSAIVLVSPPVFFSAAIVPFQLFVAAVAVYSLFIIARACWLKLEGSTAFFLGYIALAVTFFNDLLHANEFIQTGHYISLGLFLFIFSQAFLLARRFSRTYQELENTNEKLAETNTVIEEQNEELWRLNQELDSFVYRTSHDLRAPIASVMGLIDIAKREDDLLQVRYYLTLKEKSLKKLDGVIRDIIDYSKNKSLAIESSLIDFTTLVDEAYASHNYMENADKIEKKGEFIGQGDFYSDRKRIDIVLNNLISNAIRYYNPYHPQPSIQIKVSTDAQQAVIEVKDNGLGIASEYQTRIFEMFFRISNQGSGSGVGLYVVKETVQKLGGKIEVESVVNQGTLFRVCLPNLKPSAHSIPHAQEKLS